MTTPRIGLSKKDVEKVMATWGPDALARVRENPYILTKLRISLKVIDAIAADLGIDAKDPRRLKALAVEALNQDLFTKGNCYMPVHTLCQQVGITPELLAQCEDIHVEGRRVMLRRTFAAEVFIAWHVKRQQENCKT